MKKKDIVKDALISAAELEKAAKANAIGTLVEAFTPRLEDVIRRTLNEEGPGPQLDDPVTKLAKGEEEETESSEVQNDAQVSDGHPEKISPTQGDKEISNKGKKHDLDREAPKPGNMTESDDEDDDDMPIDSDPMEEGEDHDVGKLNFDDRDSGDSDFETVDEGLDMDDDDELELEADDEEDMGDEEDGAEELDLGDEGDSLEGGDDEELELPDELFDDPDEGDAEEEPEMDEDDEELDLDIVDDEPDMEDGEDMPGGDEEFEEGLYVRREGQFIKVDPAEALEDKMKDLEEERTKLANAVGFLKGQLGEVNLFNAKLAHLVKLYESGLFSRNEKKSIAVKLDECTTIKGVKAMFKKIVAETSDRTVLDSVHNVIAESRVRRNTKPTGESVYESAEVRRMKRLAGIDD